MSAEAKDGVDRFEAGEEALCLFWVLETLHLPFSRTCGLMGVLASIIQIAALPVFYLGHDLPFRCSIASEFVCDDDAGSTSCGVQ